MKQPEVSVLLPCHGEAPFLAETLLSVLDQSFTNFELLIILDRASLATTEIARNFEQSDTRIKILNTKKFGISEALNLGIQFSTGKYVARIDSDDIMLNTRLEEQIKVFQSESNLVCLGTQVSVIDINGQFIRNTNYPLRDKSIRAALRIRNVIAHPSVMFLRSAVVEVGGYRSKFNGAEDYDLWLRIAKVGRLKNLNTPLTAYRTHPGQITQRNRERQLEIDSLVRESNEFGDASISNKRISSEQRSVRLINECLREATPSRISRIAKAFLINPATVLSFIANILAPELRGRLASWKK
jgi:glycosyltransferase involved in cell wall biosynthesis